MKSDLTKQAPSVHSLVNRFSFQNIAVPFLLIFAALCVFVVGYLINRQALANPYEMFSYSFVAAAFALFLKTFILSYANCLHTVVNKKWIVFAMNATFFTIQIFLGALAALALTESTFILYPLQYLLMAAGLFYLQGLIDDRFRILSFALWGAMIYLVLYLLTLFRVFDTDNRFWNTAGLLAVIIETFLFFLATRKFFKNIATELH